jgi:5-methylcytosine-specific restriction endonuclease McrA
MFVYCVQARHYSEGAAYRRIRAARTARKFPAIFAAVADGRVHLTAVVLLAPYLTRVNLDKLLASAAHRSRSEIEHTLARRFPRPDLPARVRAIPESCARLSGLTPASVQAPDSQLTPVTQLTPASVQTPAAQPPAAQPPVPVRLPVPRPRIAPLAPERYALQLTMGQSLRDKLRHAQALLSHQMPSGNIPEVLELALDALIVKLEKRKFARVSRPRAKARAASPGSRHVPADIRRQVWERDQGRCTFVAACGRRCEARHLLEFDHVEPVVKGGGATVSNLRLRCRAHNQYEADRAFGAGFMHAKRERARGGGANECGSAAV